MSPAVRLGVIVSTVLMSCASVHVPGKPQLRASWREYVHDYVQPDGRVIDHQAGGVTTSEGQAYALLRAWWTADRDSFERLHRWTRDNLQGGDVTALPAWKWGARADGSWGVIDAAPAADADLLFVYALLGASASWDEPGFRTQALSLAAQIWDAETEEVGGRRVLLPGPWAKGASPVWLNPSYLAPFVFRALAVEDPAHPWGDLIASSYDVWARCAGPTGLPTDWCFLDPDTGAVVDPPAGEEGRVVIGYEAMRVPWLLAAEWAWFRDPRARAALDRMAGLADRFARDGRLPAVMTVEGKALVDWESRGLYDALLPTWAEQRPEHLKMVLERLDALAVDAPRAPQQGRDYYASNWVWFGLALWGGLARPLETP